MNDAPCRHREEIIERVRALNEADLRTVGRFLLLLELRDLVRRQDAILKDALQQFVTQKDYVLNDFMVEPTR